MNEALMAGAIRRQVEGGADAVLTTKVLSQPTGSLQATETPKAVKAYLYGSTIPPRVDAAPAGRLEVSGGMFALILPEDGPVPVGSAARVTLDMGGGERYKVVDAKPLRPHATVLGYLLALQSAQ